MRVHRIRLRNYRGVADSEVRFATDGVTIIEGDNEVGKTSIPEALSLMLRFQDSSRHRDVASVQPVDRDAGAEVEAEFNTGPYRLVYSKRWHRRPQTVLAVEGPRHEQLTGREAHDRVCELLEETLDTALWQALHIGQGTELALPDFDVPSLGQALDRAAAGETAGEREDDLWARICTEREKYWTPTGQPKVNRSEAERDLAEARDAVGALEQRLADIEADAVEVERRLADRTRLSRVRDAAADEEQKLGDRRQELQQLQEQVERLELENRAVVNERDRTDADMKRRDELICALAAAEENVRDLRAAAERAAPVLAAARVRAAEAEEAYRSASAALEEARGAQQRANEDSGHHRRIGELAEWRERHARVVEAQQALSEAEAHIESAQVDDELLERIESANLDVVAERAAVRSAAASVVVTALADLDFTVSGEPVELPAGSRHEFSVSRDAQITLPGVAQLDVTAGGGSRDRSAELDEACARLEALWAEGGVASVAAARRAADQRKEAERSRKDATATISRDLRDLTLDVLAQKIAGLAGRIEEYAAERPSEPALPADFEEAKQFASTAGRLVEERIEAHGRCKDAHEQARDALTEAGRGEAVLAERISNADSTRGEALAALETARTERSDADLRASLVSAQQAVAQAAGAFAQAQAAVAAADPDSLKLLLDNARAATTRAEADINDNEDSLRTLSARLELQGEAGLDEQLGEARSRCEHRAAAHERTEARAEAARLLHDTFEARRNEARLRYLAPFKQRIEQFGRIVFGPSFGVGLDDDLRLTCRTLDGVTLDVDQLSVGAREQLGVLARLACAAIVSPDGGGAPVVLDDALGWSDPGRLARMGAAIAAAGRECQVIVLTCTPGRYAHVGNAKVVTLPS
ncbi:MAG: AAA family ATPase [bacterium]|nr:AAA family ATPase [bacterium]